MAFRSSASAKSDTGGNLTATPSGVAVDDYLSGFWIADTTSVVPGYPTGWTQRVNASLSTPDGEDCYFADKIAVGSDSFTFTTSDGGENLLCTAAHSGRNTSAPRTFAVGTTNGTSNATPITAGATGGTAAAGDDLIAFFGTDQTVSGDVWNFGNPTCNQGTIVEKIDDHTTHWTAGALSVLDNVSSGATGTVSCTITRTSGTGNAGWRAIIVSVAAAATGIAFDAAGNSGDQAAASSYSGAASWNGTNRMLAIDVPMLGPGVTVTAMTYGGANCTFIGSKSTVTSFGAVECWRICSSDSGAPAAGSNTLSVTLSGSLEFAVEWASYTGVNQSVPTEAFNSAQATNVGSATDASVAITSIADNCWVHATCVANDTSVTPNQTSRNNISGTLGSGVNEDNNAAVTPAGSTTMSVTGMGITTTWAIAGYAIRNLSASSGTTLAPSTGSNTYSGNAANLLFTLAVASGVVSFSGNSPSLSNTLAVGTGAISYDGYAPGVLSSFIIAPTSGSVSYAGQVPALSFQLLPSEGTIVYTGNTPAITGAVNLHYSRRHGRCFYV